MNRPLPWLDSIRLIVVVIWIGSLWSIGFIVAPTLFATIADRALAGSIAGRLFQVEAWLGVACAVALLLLATKMQYGRRSVIVLTVAMLLCILLGYFGLQPSMAALRATAGSNGVMPDESLRHFGILHGVSSVIYGLESILGLALLLKLQRSLPR